MCLIRFRTALLFLPFLGLFALATSACGGSSGGPGPEGAGQGLVLLSFRQAGVDNVALNDVLEFDFSEPVDASSVNPGSIQIRRGDTFGATVSGTFEVRGARVLFRPALPGLCDLSDAGFDAGTAYRVQVIGHPESFALRNTRGQRLDATTTWEFHTRADGDPQKFIDALPGAAPFCERSVPADGAMAVAVGDTTNRQRIVLTMSENVDPCTVDARSVTIAVHEVGGALSSSIPAPGTSRLSGFVTNTADATDQAPSDPTTWGSDTGSPWPGGPQALPASIHLVQDFGQTQIVISPLHGQDPSDPLLGGILPDNVLIVVRLGFGIEDLGGTPLTPFALSFTTENRDRSDGAYTIEVEGETPFLVSGTTADVDTARAPSRVQGYLLFAGDGDNGSSLTDPTLPATVGSGCTVDRQSNDGAQDDFDPPTDVVLDTGGVDNTCPNTTDGSMAVVWEFRSFRIRSGITVRITGVNPAILLVQGDVTIESGGTLLARGDGVQGVPQGRGQNGYVWTSYATGISRGGVGVGGGGSGGDAAAFLAAQSGRPGFSAYGSADGRGVSAGDGAAEGGSHHSTIYPGSNGTAQGGGGGGHATAGADATNLLGPGHTTLGSVKGRGGNAYPPGSLAARMPTPSAGAGGGGGGNEEWGGTYQGIYSTGGGGGGAGGGFVDITSSGNIVVTGTIDAAGSPGGSGGTSAYYAGPGGGGGGAGGGIRLLTPNEIILGPTTTITAAGGAGGVSPLGNQGGGGPQNHGGQGAPGRVVLEDGDSVIPGLGSATVIPSEGEDGFHRGVFDASRFKGGGLTPQAVTDLVFMGPLDPMYVDPTSGDFVCGAPPVTSPGLGSDVIEIEARGFDLDPNGAPDLASGTPWQAVGRFTDSGIEDTPTYAPQAGLVALSGKEFLQFRFTIHLGAGSGPFDPGAFLDRWVIRFASDN